MQSDNHVLSFFFVLQVVWEKDLAVDSPIPWYSPLDTSRVSLSSFRLTTLGRFITKNMVSFIWTIYYYHFSNGIFL